MPTGLLSAAPRKRLLRSVGTRLALATALLMIVVSVGVYFALTQHARASLLDAKSRAARMVCVLLAEALSPALVFDDQESIGESLGYLRSNPELEQAAVFRFDPESGRVERLAGSSRRPSQPVLPAPDIARVGKILTGSEWLDVSGWIENAEGARIGIAVVRFSLANEQRSFALLSRAIMQGAAATAAGVTILLLLLASASIIRPLRLLRVAAGHLRAGARPDSQLLANLPLEAENEVGDLARAFVTMADAIARREHTIAAHNRDMRLVLDSVGQGFLVLAPDGSVVGEHSAIVERWFGPVQLERPLWELLHPHDPLQAAWMELAWANIGAPYMPLDLCVLQLPQRFEAAGHSYDFEYRPQCGADGALKRMVVIISDVSALVARQRAEAEQRELAAVLSSMAIDQAGFMSFYEDAVVLVSRISGEGASGTQLLRDVHTLKGNAGLYKLQSLAELCDQIEGRLQAEGGGLQQAERTDLTRCFDRTRNVVARFAEHGGQRELTLAAEEYEAILRAIARGASRDELAGMLMRAAAEPGDKLFARFANRLELLARTLGKCPVRVEFNAHGLRFPKAAFAPLWSAMVHAIRNVADHALETPLEREQAGKPGVAHVCLEAVLRGDTVVISLRDDGRGVNLARVRARAAELGLTISDEEAALQLLFAPSFSTADASQTLSGRGVGLSAIRAAVDELGGNVHMVQLEVGSELRIELPAGALADRTLAA